MTKKLAPKDRKLPYIAQHGTTSRYDTYKCRCVACKQAKAKANAKYRADKKAKEQ